MTMPPTSPEGAAHGIPPAVSCVSRTDREGHHPASFAKTLEGTKPSALTFPNMAESLPGALALTDPSSTGVVGGAHLHLREFCTRSLSTDFEGGSGGDGRFASAPRWSIVGFLGQARDVPRETIEQLGIEQPESARS